MSTRHEFIPKSVVFLRKYSLALFRRDLVAGLTVGVIALPLAMAFAIASGVSPERGLFTAIVAGFLISALGGSRLQIGGPTGAFVVIIYDIIQRTGYEGLALSTLLAGVLLIFLGIFRIGSWIKYVPYPLITGFTTGIALIIFSSQIKDFFGLNMGPLPVDFMGKWMAYFHQFGTIDPATLSVGGGTLASILLVRRFAPKVPWGIAAIVVATGATYLLQIPVETIYSKFGEIPRSLPFPSLPTFTIAFTRFPEIAKDAITIALLGGIESLLSAVIADGMVGSRHKSNCELVAQGIANIGSILFGGIPATGAIARTAASIKMGAATPVAGMIHAVTLFLIILFLAPLVSLIPLAGLAAILMMVAWNMSEAGHFIRLFRAPAGDMAILLTAFLLTVFVDITAAVLFGMILASFLFMKRMGELCKTVSITNKSVPPNVEVYEIQGPFFFGAADMLQNLLAAPPKVFILRMRHVPFIDASGMNALREFYHRCKETKTTLLLTGIQPHAKKDMDRFGFTQQIGPTYIFPHIDSALFHAAELVINRENIFTTREQGSLEITERGEE